MAYNDDDDDKVIHKGPWAWAPAIIWMGPIPTFTTRSSLVHKCDWSLITECTLEVPGLLTIQIINVVKYTVFHNNIRVIHSTPQRNLYKSTKMDNAWDVSYWSLESRHISLISCYFKLLRFLSVSWHVNWQTAKFVQTICTGELRGSK